MRRESGLVDALVLGCGSSHVRAARARFVPSNAAARRVGSSSRRLHASASACSSPGGTTSPRPKSRTVSPSEPTSATTTGRPWPSRRGRPRRWSACTGRRPPSQHASARRPRPPGGSRGATILSSTPTSRASCCSGRRDRADRRPRRAAQPGSPPGRARARRALVRAQEAEEEQRPAGGRHRSSRACDSKTACGMYSMAPREAERGELVDAAPRVDDHALDRVVDPLARVDARAVFARQRVVGGEHGRVSAAVARSQRMSSRGSASHWTCTMSGSSSRSRRESRRTLGRYSRPFTRSGSASAGSRGSSR